MSRRRSRGPSPRQRVVATGSYVVDPDREDSAGVSGCSRSPIRRFRRDSGRFRTIQFQPKDLKPTLEDYATSPRQVTKTGHVSNSAEAVRHGGGKVKKIDAPARR